MIETDEVAGQFSAFVCAALGSRTMMLAPTLTCFPPSKHLLTAADTTMAKSSGMEQESHGDPLLEAVGIDRLGGQEAR